MNMRVKHVRTLTERLRLRRISQATSLVIAGAIALHFATKDNEVIAFESGTTILVAAAPALPTEDVIVFDDELTIAVPAPVATKKKPVVKKARKDVEYAALEIDTVAGAQIFVDGKSAGRAPIEPMELTAGPHKVKVQKDGLVFEEMIELPAGRTLNYRVTF